jgi:paraquat-inducible protein B
VTFTVFVNAPYDSYVKANSRFWNASGIDLAIDANGMKLDTQSLISILVGGIAFQTLNQDGDAPPTDPNSAFTLFNNREEAMKNRDTISQSYVLVFKESVRGLTAGAAVDFRGLTIGEVTGIRVEYDNKSKQIDMLVDIRLFPERLRSRSSGKIPRANESREMLNAMVASGLRAQLKSGNMLTGQLFVALDYFPNAPKVKVAWNANPPRFPTTPGSLIELQAALDKLFKKIDELPLGEVVDEVRQVVQSLDTTLKSTDTMIRKVDTEVVPEVKAALEDTRKTLGAARQTLSADAPLQSDLRDALRELAKAAQSLRVLTDYLERHPETLIRGKQEDKQ